GAMRDALRALTLDDGRPALDGVWTFEELYGRPRAPDGPTLVFAPTAGARPALALSTPAVTRAPEQGRGAHQRDGILLIAGPGVSPGDLGRASIYDVSPTLLAAMDAPVPADSDGRVLFEAFDPSFASGLDVREADTRVEREASESSSEEVVSRL